MHEISHKKVLFFGQRLVDGLEITLCVPYLLRSSIYQSLRLFGMCEHAHDIVLARARADHTLTHTQER